MLKRDIKSFAAAGVDLDAPRAKRHKHAAAASTANPDARQDMIKAEDDEDVDENGDEGVVAGVQADEEDREEVREKGLQLLQTVKDAVNKQGLIASAMFMRLPSKRQYADYYLQIKRPIALEDIKAQLDAKGYSSFLAVKNDIGLCFRNAKRYNIKESQIFSDAKFLHKLTLKEYARMTGTKEEGDEEKKAGGSDDDGEGKKKKGPNMNRLLKTRLQKLAEKTDDNGRVLAAEFMELPNKKQWPIYYKTIKRPQCLENIFKHVKRKEYHTPTDFANDVELVFSNALEFNQEHTQIWEDAVVLRDYFRQLMSDLPEPFSIPAYATAGDHPTRVKLKMPGTAPKPAPAIPAPTAAPAAALPSSNSITIPRKSSGNIAATKQAPAATSPPDAPKLPTATASVPTAAPALPQASSSRHTIPPPLPPPATPAQPVAQPANPIQPTSYAPPAVPQSYPTQPAYHPSAVAHTPSLASTSNIPVITASPPPDPGAHPLKYACLTTSIGRRLALSRDDGVRVWFVRLAPGEAGVSVSDVEFVGREEQEDGSGSEDETPATRQEEEEGEDEEEVAPARKRKAGRPPKKRAKLAEAEAKKGKGKKAAALPPPSPAEEVQVKLHGVVVRRSEAAGAWEMQLPLGLAVLEIGERGGPPWKVYLDRPAL